MKSRFKQKSPWNYEEPVFRLCPDKSRGFKDPGTSSISSNPQLKEYFVTTVNKYSCQCICETLRGKRDHGILN